MKHINLLILFVIFISCRNEKQEQVSEAHDSIAAAPDSRGTTDLTENYVFKDAALKAYELFLDSLDASDIESMQLATQKFKELFNNKDQATADSAYFIFNGFYSSVDGQVNTRLEHDTTNYDSLVSFYEGDSRPRLSQRLTDFEKKVNRNGFQLSSTEGMVYIEQDGDYSKDNLYTSLSPVMITYLEQLNRENKEGFGEEADSRSNQLCLSTGSFGGKTSTAITLILSSKGTQDNNGKFIYQRLLRA